MIVAPRWRKVLRDLWLHKARSALVTLAIVVGIVGAGSVLDTWALIRTATVDEFRESQPASATLTVDSVDAALLGRVRQRPEVRLAQARRTVLASIQTRDGTRTALLFAADDLSDTRIGKLKPEAGAWPPRDGEVVIESSSVSFSGLGIGDAPRVQYRDSTERQLAVSGVVRDVGLAPGWMEHVVYGFVTRATLAKLGAPSTLNELQIVVADRPLDRSAIRQVAYDLKGTLEAEGHRVTNVDVPQPGRHIHAGQINSLLFTQGAFGVLALLLSGLLVVNLITAMLAGQVREIGVMKAVGAGAGQIARMYLALALVLGVVACVIAIPAAGFIGREYARFTADLLNFSVEGIAIPAWIVLAQIGVGVLLPVVAASVPVVHGCRVTVVEALRDFGIGTQGARRARAGVLSRVAGVTRPVLLSVRNAFRKRQRMVLTLLTLATGGAVYLGALNLRAAVRASVDLMYAPQKFDASVRFARPWPPDSLEAAVQRVSGVASVEAWGGARGALSYSDGTMGNSFPIAAPPAATRQYSPHVVAGRWLSANDSNALVVGTRLVAEDSAMRLGADVPLVVGGKVTRWRIVGIVDAGPSPTAFASREALARVTGDGRVDRVVVSSTLRGAGSQLELVQRLRPTLGAEGYDVQSAQMVQSNRGAIEDHLLMVAGFLGIMGQLIIVVGGLGLAATMSLAVLERTREIGVLRAIGARHGSIMTMIHIEGLVIALASWLIALPLSVPMSVILGKAFGRVMLPVPVILLPEWAGVVRWLAVVIGVSLVSCAWPAIRAMRVTTASALAYE